MKHIISVLLLFIINLSASAQTDTLRMYLIGNSLTGNGETHRDIEMRAFGQSIGRPVYAEQSTYVYTMQEAFNTAAIMDKIRTGRWDYVCFQSNPYEAAPDLFGYTTWTSRLIDSVRAAGAIPVIYICMNINGSPRGIVADSCLNLARRKHAAVIPVNMAFRAVTAVYPNVAMPLYGSGSGDWVHPGYLGGYLAGCTFFSAVFGKNPFNLPILYGITDTAMANYMKTVAFETVMADSLMDVRLPWPQQPVMPVSIRLISYADTLTQYLKQTVNVAVVYSDNSKDTSNFGHLRSLDTNLISVDYKGIITGLAVGRARICVKLLNLSDTLTVQVKPSTAVLDSIRIFPGNFSGTVADGQPLSVTGYFHETSFAFSRDLSSAVTWHTDSSLVKIENGMVRRISARADTVEVAVTLDDRCDSITFVLEPHLKFIARVNFKLDTVPPSLGWRADNGSPYTEARGLGWLSIETGPTIRVDRLGNFLQNSFISPATESEFKIKALDGDYILKISMGDNLWGDGSALAHVRYRNIDGTYDTLVRHVGASNTVRIDTIRVFGNDGIHLFVKGPINYILAISKENVNINDVAMDNGTVISTASGKNLFSPSCSISAFPNPFKAGTQLRASLSSGAPAVLSMHDLTGKIVRSWNLTNKRSIQAVLWDAKNSYGQSMATGFYICRLESAGIVKTTRIILLK